MKLVDVRTGRPLKGKNFRCSRAVPSHLGVPLYGVEVRTADGRWVGAATPTGRRLILDPPEGGLTARTRGSDPVEFLLKDGEIPEPVAAGKLLERFGEAVESRCRALGVGLGDVKLGDPDAVERWMAEAWPRHGDGPWQPTPGVRTLVTMPRTCPAAPSAASRGPGGGAEKAVIPAGSLVVTIGPPGSGKTTAARKIAEAGGDPGMVISTDDLRNVAFGTPEEQGDPGLIHAAARALAEARLLTGRTVIYDALSLKPSDRAALLRLADRVGAPAVAIWVDADPELTRRRNRSRDRAVPDRIVEKSIERARTVTARQLAKEGFTRVIRIAEGEQLDPAVEAHPSGWDRRRLGGPFDVIGDIHGCYHTLIRLVSELGYDPETGRHPDGRILVSVGDIVDRGAWPLETAAWARRLSGLGTLLVVSGNHEAKASRYLARLADVVEEALAAGEDPAPAAEGLISDMAARAAAGDPHGLDITLRAAYRRLAPEQMRSLANWMRRLPHHLVLDGGRLVVAHGGVVPEAVGREGPEHDRWLLYGAPVGEGPDGTPARSDWQLAWDGPGVAVCGHTAVSRPRITAVSGRLVSVMIDTGAAFGRDAVDAFTGERFEGRLTAYRHPERLFHSVRTLAADRPSA